VVAVTVVVLMVYAGDTVAPAATVTEAGTVAAALLLCSVTTAPLAGAGPVSVTVAEVEIPPTTDEVVRFTCDAAGGPTVSVPGAVFPLYVAVIVTGVLVATAVVVMVNAGDTVAPAATVTVAGTVVLGSLLDNATITPPVGAGPFRLTVADVDTPPNTDDVVSVATVAIKGPTIKVAGTVTPL
jgi:hypothetical protein